MRHIGVASLAALPDLLGALRRGRALSQTGEWRAPGGWPDVPRRTQTQRVCRVATLMQRRVCARRTVTRGALPAVIRRQQAAVNRRLAVCLPGPSARSSVGARCGPGGIRQMAAPSVVRRPCLVHWHPPTVPRLRPLTVTGRFRDHRRPLICDFASTLLSYEALVSRPLPMSSAGPPCFSGCQCPPSC